MTHEQKELLMKDLSARLPYKVKAQIPDEYGGYTSAIETIDIDGFVVDFEGTQIEVEYIKPYLYPMSSMTDEQIDELKDLCDMYDPVNDNDDYEDWGTCLMTKHFMDDVHRFKFNFQLVDFLNKNRLDYNGLIPMGLAIDATGKNIY